MKVTNLVNYWHLPIGFPISRNGKTTTSDVTNWKKNNNPNFIQKASYLTISGVIAVITGSLITLVKETKASILGALLALGGIGAIIASYIKTTTNSSIEATQEKPNKQEKEGEPTVDFWISVINDKTKSALERSNAVKVLGKRKERSALNTLIECLEDDSTTVRTASAWALGEIKDKQALEPLIKIAQSNSEDTSKRLIDTAKAAIRKIRSAENLQS